MRATPGYPMVLHVIASLARGGTEGQLVEFINRSSCPERHRVAVFYEPGALAGRIPNAPIVVGRIRPRLRYVPAALGMARSLRGAIRRLETDLVHAHLGLGELVAAAVTPKRIPLVASRRGHNIGFEDRSAMRLVEGLGHRRVDLLICNSRYLADRTLSADLWPPPIEVIHNAVDAAIFAPAPAPSGGPPTVAVVANFQPYKGHETFLRAFALVLRSVPDARAVLVGHGKRREGMGELVAVLGIERNVEFVGASDDPRPHMAGSHVVALTSEHEGFPNVLLEAMAMARPVVATRVGGVPELVRDGVDGFLTSSRPEDIAARLVTLLDDPSLRERMGREARARAESFSWDRVVRETEAVYRRVLHRRGGADLGLA